MLLAKNAGGTPQSLTVWLKSQSHQCLGVLVDTAHSMGYTRNDIQDALSRYVHDY